jgi:hypothetical protein
MHSYKLAVARIRSRLGRVPVQALTPFQIERLPAPCAAELVAA